MLTECVNTCQASEHREARLRLVPAFWFDCVPGDLGAAAPAASGLGSLERIDVVYARS